MKRLALMLLVAGLALGIRLHYFVGAFEDDDLGFTGFAHSFSQNPSLEHSNDQSMRRGTFLPIGLSYMLFGDSYEVTYVYPLFCATGLVVLVFLIASMLWGTAAGVFSGLILGLMPIHVLMSTRAMPSVPEAFWSALAVYGVLLRDRGASRWTLPLIGISGFMSYFTRETGVVILIPIFLFFILMAILRRKPGMVADGIGVGFFAGPLFAVESWVAWRSTGDPLYRFHIVSEAQGGVTSGFDFRVYYHFLLNVRSLSVFPFSPMDPEQTVFAGWGWLVVPGLVLWFSLNRPSSTGWMVPLWFFGIFLFLQFGSGSLSHYVPLRKFPRYTILFAAPTALLGGYLLGWLWDRTQLPLRYVLRGGVMAVMLLFSVKAVDAVQVQHPLRSAYLQGRTVQGNMKRLIPPDGTVYVDSNLSNLFWFWDMYRGTPYKHTYYLEKDRMEKNLPETYWVTLERSDADGRYYSVEWGVNFKTPPPQFEFISDLGIFPYPGHRGGRFHLFRVDERKRDVGNPRCLYPFNDDPTG